MQRVAAGAVAFAVVLLALPAFAGTTGGPGVGPGQLEIGYQMDYSVRDMDFKSISNGMDPTGWTNGEIRQLNHAATISYGFSDLFEGEVRLGGDHLNQLKDEIAQPNEMLIHDGLTFSWGLGGKVTVPAVFMMVDLVVGAQYNQCNYKNVDGNFQEANDADGVEAEVSTSQWQVDVIGSIKYQQITPSADFRYSDQRTDLELRFTTAGANPNSATAKYEAARNWGGIAGADIEFTPEFSGNLEGRFIDEDAEGVKKCRHSRERGNPVL